MKRISTLFGLTLLGGTLLLPSMAFASAQDTIQRQFSSLTENAEEAHSGALGVQDVNQSNTSNPSDMRQQIDIIMPAEQAMRKDVNLLQAMQPNMTPAQRRALNTITPAIRKLSANAEQLQSILDEHGIDVQSPSFKVIAGRIAREANVVENQGRGVSPASAYAY